MIRKIVLLFMLFSLFPLIAFADLKVTAVKSSSDKYEVILNNAVKLKNLTVKKDKSGEYVVFPTYASKGKLYIQFGVLRRDFNRVDLLAAIKENKVSQSGGEISFEINKFSRVKNHENVEAFCSVIFDGVLEVFCRIIKGKNGLWIAWPAHKVDGKWVKDFDFVDLNFKERVEGTLMERLTASG